MRTGVFFQTVRFRLVLITVDGMHQIDNNSRRIIIGFLLIENIHFRILLFDFQLFRLFVYRLVTERIFGRIGECPIHRRQLSFRQSDRLISTFKFFIDSYPNFIDDKSCPVLNIDSSNLGIGILGQQKHPVLRIFRITGVIQKSCRTYAIYRRRNG